MEDSVEENNNRTGLEIAIIGMSGRFPGSSNLHQFWQNLAEGRECISFFSDEELLASGVSPDQFERPEYVRARGILKDPESFDAGFFKLTPREAEIMDPQQRLFLECAWEAFEDAGYVPDTFKGLIGVFAGVGTSTYFFYQIVPALGSGFAFNDAMSVLSNEKDFLPTRVSYKLNLKGPSVAVSTGCSSSLVATHMACKSLLAGECDMALAGGVSVHFPVKNGYIYAEGGFASPDGHCRSFDAQAQGSVFGSGVGVVLLKRLEDALNDRDSIYGVIKGSAMNNDGSRRIGFTAPSIEGQCEVIRMARFMAGVDPDSITYIETHGSATPIGDPIEIQALIEAASATSIHKQSCGVGSVKTNIGHTAEAAGVAGLIKTTLSLKHRKIPASLHFTKPNPKLGLENSPFYVNDKLKDWNANGSPLRAGVSSFGIGGSNAHLVLEESPKVISEGSHRNHHLITISARSTSAVEAQTDQMRAFLAENRHINLADVAFTSQVGRKAFDYRRVLICHDVDDAVKTLETRDRQKLFSNAKPSREAPNVVMMFPGLGDDHGGMAVELYQTEPVFRAELDRCIQLLQQEIQLELRVILKIDSSSASANNTMPAPRSGPDLRRMLGRNHGNGTVTGHVANGRTDLAQIALFITELALARLWLHWGLQPKALIGYSLGEFTAACVAEVFSLPNAIKIVSARARLIQSLSPGAMLAVPLPEKDMQHLVGEDLCIAAVNGPSLTVLSGPVVAIDDLQTRLKFDGVDTRRVQTSHALHSQSMSSITESLTEFVKQFPARPPKIPYLSNVTGDWIQPQEACSPEYWARHLCGTVRFGEGIEKLRQSENHIFLEVGPGQTLCSLVLQHPACRGESALGLQSLSSVYDKVDDSFVLLSSLGRLWLEGCAPNWTLFHADDPRSRLSLPTYPFERKVYRVQPAINQAVSGSPMFPQPRVTLTEPIALAPKPKIPGPLPQANVGEAAVIDIQHVLPETELQHKVAGIWYELLGIEQIGIYDSFFKLGGDSLLGTRLISRLKEMFPIELPLRKLVESPTIAQLSETIELLLLEKLNDLSDQEAADLAENLG